MARMVSAVSGLGFLSTKEIEHYLSLEFPDHRFRSLRAYQVRQEGGPFHGRSGALPAGSEGVCASKDAGS